MTIDDCLAEHGTSRAEVHHHAKGSGAIVRALAQYLEHTAEQQPRELSAGERFERARVELAALSAWLKQDGNPVAAKAVDGAASLLAGIAAWCGEGAA